MPRPQGSRNKATQDRHARVAEVAKRMGYDPEYNFLEVLAEIAFDKTNSPALRADAAARACPYMFSRLNSVTVENVTDNTQQQEAAKQGLISLMDSIQGRILEAANTSQANTIEAPAD